MLIIRSKRGEGENKPTISAINLPVFIIIFFNLCVFFRLALLKKGNHKVQEFESAVQSLDFFLVNLPNNSVKPTDGLAEITAKEKSQRVRGFSFPQELFEV